jgi:hypothetical protein
MEERYKERCYGGWEVYGLRYDPFFVGPILVFGGEISKSTFIGREEKIKRLKKIFISGSSRIIVSGEPGVGKTSFVNVVRSGMQEKQFFTTIREIAVQPEWSANDFILNTLFAIFNTLKRRDLGSILTNELYKELESLITLVRLDNYSGSVSVLGSGAGGGKGTTFNNPQITVSYLQDIFERFVQELKDNNYKGIIIHYNNLENFESTRLISFFNKIRDFLLVENVNFVFVGDLTVPPILQSVQRVSSIFNDSAIILENLTFEQVKKILAKRIESLSIDGLTYVIPYEEEAVKVLYDLYSGNIRNILNSLSTAIREISDEVPVVLNKKMLCTILSGVAEEKWLKRIPQWEKEILFCILENPEITNAEISEKLNKKRQNISKVVSKLLNMSAIFVKRAEGTQKFLEVHPSVKWFLLSEKLENKTKQSDLLKYFN